MPVTPGKALPLLGPPVPLLFPGSWLFANVLPVTLWPAVLSASPFDTEMSLVSPSPTVKLSVGSRKGSLYNWTPPSTPSFRERYYLVSGPGVLWSRWG